MPSTGRGSTPPPLILASSSATRRALLERLGLPFTARSPDIDERALPDEAPEEMVLRLAAAKAGRIAAGVQGRALVIGCDQVGVIGTRVLGKPADHDEAVEQLEAASGRTLRFLSAVCLLEAASGRLHAGITVTEARFRRLGRPTIEAYLRRDRPYDCAGSFRSEGLGVLLIDALASEDPTAILGLPLIRLARMLEDEGLHILGD